MKLAKCIADERLCIVEVDQAFADLLMEEVASLSGRSIYDIVHPDDLASNRRLLDRLRTSGKPFSMAKRYLRRDGEAVWVNSHVTRVEARDKPMTLVAEVQAMDPSGASIDRLVDTGQRILHQRRVRPRFFGPGLFGEPDFDILLDLFINTQRGQTVTVGSACIASGVPEATALRYIANLIELGWMERVGDPNDKRRRILTLTSEGSGKIQRYLEECSG